MARAWRRSALAAVAAAILGAACVAGLEARAAQDEAEEEPAQAAPDEQQPKSGKKRTDPADAQRAIESALKQLQAGRPELALQSMTNTLSGGNLPPAIMARALYVRAMAFRQQRRPAQAISDLNSALWLKGGLGADDRDQAIKERSAAYADAGLGVDAEGPAPKSAGGNWLSGLFGGSSGASPDPPPRRPAPAQPPSAPVAKAEPAPPPPPPKAAAVTPGGWSSTTQAPPSRPAAVAASPPPQARPAPPRPEPAAPAPARSAPAAARLDGQHLVQLAAVRTEAEARALAAKAKREAALAGREAVIDPAVLGNMGTFYRVRFGPFASAQETQAVCARLQGSGFDCLPVGP